MDIGLMMDADYRRGQTEWQAFEAALTTADLAERLGFDGVWLAERHFSPPGGTALISSVGSAPLLLATAIATRTSRIRIGTAVLLLPLGHPVRLAEEVATLDHLSRGRLDLGIGRSSFPRAYEGYHIPYGESRERFREYLEVMRLAWTQPRFSYTGAFYTCQDLEVIPKPYQQPHPPLHQAAATRDTFAAIGTMGLSLLVALIGTPLSQLATVIAEYQTAWQAAGHPGRGEVRLRLPIYVADTLDQAQADPYQSVMAYYERLRQGYLRSAQRFDNAEHATLAAQLATLTYEEVMRERVLFGTPSHVAARLRALQEMLGLCGIIIEPNVGGDLPPERVARSLDLFFREVAPQLREKA
ncbi:MAG TPA: LLM class flavin-dependent oxidoreductase [Alphaproteobacteria bacterium]|nr:LLM class flavin-dependent oxidoreductase [Alphaproteobacteria bacterium]